MRLSSLQNPFKPKAHQDAEKLKEQTDAKLKEAELLAKACFGTEQFQQYRDAYKKAEASTIDFMLRFNNSFFAEKTGDVQQYAFTIMRYLTRLQTLRSLLDTIETNAKRGTEQ